MGYLIAIRLSPCPLTPHHLVRHVLARDRSRAPGLQVGQRRRRLEPAHGRRRPSARRREKSRRLADGAPVEPHGHQVPCPAVWCLRSARLRHVPRCASSSPPTVSAPWLLQLADALFFSPGPDQYTSSSYLTTATSVSFKAHSTLATIRVIKSVFQAVSQPPIAKV